MKEINELNLVTLPNEVAVILLDSEENLSEKVVTSVS